MRPFILIAIPALLLAACGKDAQDDSGNTASAGLTAENIVTNDITAIDAVTADAANMAADVDYTDALATLSNNSGDAAPGTRNSASDSARPPRSSPAQTPAETATNSQ